MILRYLQIINGLTTVKSNFYFITNSQKYLFKKKKPKTQKKYIYINKNAVTIPKPNRIPEKRTHTDELNLEISRSENNTYTDDFIQKKKISDQNNTYTGDLIRKISIE